jgi:hypothetical protein
VILCSPTGAGVDPNRRQNRIGDGLHVCGVGYKKGYAMELYNPVFPLCPRKGASHLESHIHIQRRESEHRAGGGVE